MIAIKVDASELRRLASRLKEAKLKKAQTKRIAQGTVELMKEQIAKGISPIASAGRFPSYKNPARYPGGLKPQRPVNLKLTGDFLAALSERIDSPNSFSIGYFKSSEAIKEQGHREGANGQKKRPTIPQGSEQFNQTIQRQIADGFAEALDDAVGEIGK